MERYQRIVDILWVLASLTICVAAMQMGLGTFSEPGPGFMMFGVGFMLCFVSLSVVLQKAPQFGTERLLGPYWKRAIYIFLLLMGYGVVLTTLGYLLSTFLLMLTLFWATGHKGWITLVLKTVFSVGITYLVFGKWLDCQLPQGIFGF